MEPVVISAQCLETDPQVVLVLIRGPNGIVYGVQFRPEDYAIVALLPGFPPNPCA